MRSVFSICKWSTFIFHILLATTNAVFEDNLLVSSASSNCLLGACEVDGNVGGAVIFEDSTTKIWSFTLGPGEITSMHKHDCGYHFVALSSAKLELYGNGGGRLMDFNIKEGDILGFSIENDMLMQTASNNPINIPRIHAAKNIGQTTFKEILFESKLTCVDDFIRDL